MEQLYKNRNYLYFFVAGIFLVGAFFMDVISGSQDIPLRGLWAAFWQTGENPTWEAILWKIRLPRVFTAMLAGAALSVSGLLMQTLFRNPIAGPYVLGISSGASLGVAILILGGGGIGLVSQWSLAMAAALGAALVLFLVLLVARRVRDVATLLIAGLMFGSVTGAIVIILEYFSGQEELKQFVLWSFGNLSGVTWEDLYILTPLVCIVGIFSFFISKNLNALLLGEEYAQSLGVNIQRNRYFIIGITAIGAGVVTAFCGPIAFVGIAVPHIARMLFKTQQHQVLVPASILLGMGILLFCDWFSQLAFTSDALPINAITSLMGAPFVIWIVLYQKRIY